MKLTAYEKKVSFIFGVAFILMIVSSLLMLNGCGAGEADNNKSEVTDATEKTAVSGEALSVVSDQEKSESAIEQVSPPEEYFCKQDVGEFTVYVYPEDARKIDDELSPYNDTYEGEFHIDVYQGNQRKDSTLYEIEGGSETHFTKGFELGVTDYNKDGLDDFALGNRISSNWYGYRFYSIDKDGRLRNLLDHEGKRVEICANNDGFSPLFENKEQTVYFRVYDMTEGEYHDKNVVFGKETE